MTWEFLGLISSCWHWMYPISGMRSGEVTTGHLGEVATGWHTLHFHWNSSSFCSSAFSSVVTPVNKKKIIFIIELEWEAHYAITYSVVMLVMFSSICNVAFNQLPGATEHFRYMLINNHKIYTWLAVQVLPLVAPIAQQRCLVAPHFVVAHDAGKLDVLLLRRLGCRL